MLSCMLLALAEYNPGQHQKLTAILKVSASMIHTDRIQAIEDIKLTGQLPTVGEGLEGKRLIELAGLMEMIAILLMTSWIRLKS